MQARFGDDYQQQRFETVDVPVRTLNEILYTTGAPRRMEVVSIDIEGAEIEALRGFDLTYWQPRLLILEADDDTQLGRLQQAVAPAGYKLARMVGVNGLFCRSGVDAARVRLARVDRSVLHTHNPADTEAVDRTILPSAYETRRQFAGRLLTHFGRAA